MAFYDTLKLEKGMYTAGKGFTRTLEELDPSANYEGTPLAGLDAYQRQLKRFDIRVGGPGSDPAPTRWKNSFRPATVPRCSPNIFRARCVREWSGPICCPALWRR